MKRKVTRKTVIPTNQVFIQVYSGCNLVSLILRVLRMRRLPRHGPGSQDTRQAAPGDVHEGRLLLGRRWHLGQSQAQDEKDELHDDADA